MQIKKFSLATVGSLCLVTLVHAQYRVHSEQFSQVRSTNVPFSPKKKMTPKGPMSPSFAWVSDLDKPSAGLNRVGWQNRSSGAVFSWMPNDRYFTAVASFGPSPDADASYQWGMYAMNFPAAWNLARGSTYIGVMDRGFPGFRIDNYGSYQIHPDLVNNFRGAMSLYSHPITTFDNKISYHTVHVMGIIAAEAANEKPNTPDLGGVAGGCPTCSIANFPIIAPNGGVISPGMLDDNGETDALKNAILSGMTIINWSGNIPPAALHNSLNGSRFRSCDEPGALTETSSLLRIFCPVLDLAKARDVLIVESTGNNNLPADQLPFPMNVASQYTVLPVGGTASRAPRPGYPNDLWVATPNEGSNAPGVNGVIAPAKNIVSTALPNTEYIADPYRCSDIAPYDDSGRRFLNGYGDGYGTCSGTSMAAPHVTALAGLIRSIHPLMTADRVRQIIQESGNLSGSQATERLGSGLPDAYKAVRLAINDNPKQLTPLFSFYSAARQDAFYTTVPQMAAAAMTGSLMPKQEGCATSSVKNCGTYSPKWGRTITAYGNQQVAYNAFPGMPSNSAPPVAVFGGSPVIDANTTPLADAWVFTTPNNPRDPSKPLVPLYRLSYQEQTGLHRDTTYTTDLDGVSFYESLRYLKDGIEGYIYPKTMPQPPGTVRLMRKYNPALNDTAIFPEYGSRPNDMTAQGYTTNVGSDWLGWVYPNTDGKVPNPN